MGGPVVFISLSLLAVCFADVPVSPPVTCGPMPVSVYQCLGTPRVVQPGISSQCKKDLSECEKITCIYQKSGWMNGNKVDNAKLSAYFDEFALNNPAWQPAVDSLKTTCLLGDLPAQGIYLNCPAYDSMQCTFSSFIKHAQSSQWSSKATCENARQFAASCPVCPSDCFSAQIPIGSCNACLSLRRTP